MKIYFPFLFSLLFTITLSAQKAPIKWGKVDKADLNMKTYDLDPEAEAVVLTDYAFLEFDFSTGDTKYKMDRIVRIKILKKSAFDRGNININYYSYAKSEKISGLKAQVILPNGKKIEVNKKDIFEEEINKSWSSKKFAFPSLEEGCIIEYKYTKISDQLSFLDDWYFQSDIPVRLSDFRTSIPDWFRYVSLSQGMRPLTEKSELKKSVRIPRQRDYTGASISPRGRSSSVAGNTVDANIIRTRYYLENIPALKQENFITTMRDYYAKIALQLQSINFPNSPVQNINSDWGKLAKELEISSSLGNQINKKRNTKNLMAAIAPKLAGAENDIEKVAIIYSFICANVSWNQDYGLTSSSLDKAFENKTAKSGELNLMLIAICRQLDIQAYPVLISTRTHGKTMQYYPKIDQFNHIIAFVQAGGNQSLLDVGSPYRDPGLLRLNSLNYNGWLMNGEDSQWINIPVNGNKEIAMATLSMDESGTLSGSVNQSFKGYSAMEGRRLFYINKEEDHKHIREEWQERFPDINIKSIDFKDQENITQSLKCNLEIEIPQAGQVTGDFIYFSPMLGLGYDENPLKQEKRTFPVDIPLTSKDQLVLNLTIPEGYSVEELPEAINMKMDGNAGRFQFLVSQNGNTIQIISKTTISKLRFEPEEYPIIKGFLDLVVEKHGEQIVLKKNT